MEPEAADVTTDVLTEFTDAFVGSEVTFAVCSLKFKVSRTLSNFNYNRHSDPTHTSAALGSLRYSHKSNRDAKLVKQCPWYQGVTRRMLTNICKILKTRICLKSFQLLGPEQFVARKTTPW